MESLARRLPLRAGMRVLDLGCGRAMSSIFMAREFGARVWAVDVGISPSDNRGRVIELDCESSVFPLQVDAHPMSHPAADAGMVWVNTRRRVYYGASDRWYGKSRNGAYRSEADAKR